MLIFGHNRIEAEEFFRIENIEDIKIVQMVLLF